MLEKAVTFLHRHWPLFVVAILFVTISQLSLRFAPELRELFAGDSTAVGIVTFVVIGLILSLLPAVSTLPLVPIATTLWGWQTASLVTMALWTLGSQIQFTIARRVGERRMKWFFHADQAKTIRALVSTNAWSRAVLLRIVLDGELVSYAYGFFSHLSGFAFFTSTLVGVIVPAIFYCYIGAMPLWVQLVAMATGGLIFWLTTVLRKAPSEAGNTL